MQPEREGLTVGRSLWPVLRGGRRLKAVGRPPKVGEVAVYRLGSALRAHRVLARSDQSLLVRGDHPAVPLERVALERVVGVWAPTGAWLTLALGAATGRAIGTVALAAGRASVLRAARRLSDLTPRRRSGACRVGVAKGPGDRLAVELGGVGLLRPLHAIEAVEDALLGDTGFAVVARTRRGTVGALRALPTEGGLLLGVALTRRHRGQGLGRRLLDAALAEARVRHAPVLLADIRRDNVASLRLFQGAGFTRVAEAVLVAPGAGVLLDRYALALG